MNSIQSVYHSSFDHPSLANDEWINHYQQKELERLRQVQHQAALQQQRALMHQQSKNDNIQYTLIFMYIL